MTIGRRRRFAPSLLAAFALPFTLAVALLAAPAAAAPPGSAAAATAAAPAPATPAAGPPVPVHGRVEDDARRPLAGAVVRLYPDLGLAEAAELHAAGAWPPPHTAEATTAADGTFTVNAPSPGLWRLVAEAPQRAPREISLAPLVEEVWLPVAKLPADEPLTLVVSGPDGKPLAGAVVLAARKQIPWGPAEWAAPVARQLSAADGKVVVRRARGDQLDIWATGSGLAVSSLEGARGGTARVALAAGSRRALLVEAADGRPAAGVVVTTERGLSLGRTGPGGRLALPLQRGESLAIHLEGADGAEAQLTAEPLPQGAEAVPLRVRLRSPRRVAGRVIDAESRLPMAGALVWSASGVWGSGPGVRHAVTDARGGFVLDGVPAEPRALAGGAAGYFTNRVSLPATAITAPTLALDPAAAVRGVVVDAAGKPLADVEVSAAAVEGMMMRRRSRTTPLARSDAAGRFRIGPLDPSLRHQLTFRRSGYATAERELSVSRGQQPELRVTLESGATARGTVVDGSGNPVAGAKLELKRIPEPGPRGRRVFAPGEAPPAESASDRDGRFAFTGLAAGRYQLTATATGFAAATLPGVEVPAAARMVEIGEVALEAGVAVAGQVTDEQGAPLPGAEVFVLDAREAQVPMLAWVLGQKEATAVTAADGFFLLPDRRPGERLDLAVTRSGYTAGRLAGVTVPAEQPVVVTLKSASTLRGRVVDERGDPVSGAHVTLMAERADGGSFFSNTGAVTGSDGRFTIEDVEPAIVRVGARAEGYLPAERGSVEVTAGRDVSGLELVLRPGAVVEGIVTGADGSPVIGADVAVQEEGQGQRIGYSGATTDGDGRYRLDAVEPGARTIAAYHPDWQRGVAELEVQPGTQRLDLRLAAGLPVRGRVTGARGEPVAGAAVRIGQPRASWSRYQAITDDTGAFSVEGVPAGAYEAVAEHRDHAPARQPLVIGDGPVPDLLLELGPALAITGALRGLSPAELAQANVMANADGQFRQGTVSHDGRYRVDGVGPGDWRVWAALGDGARQASGRVQIAEGQSEAVVDLDFTGGVTLAGTVRHQGRPADGVRLIVRGTAVSGFGSAITDQQGRYRIENLEPGAYRYDAMDSQRGLRERGTVAIEGDYELDLDLRSGRLSGTVLDAGTGEPLAGADVRLAPVDDDPAFRYYGGGSSTDDDGRFLLAGVGSGGWRVKAEKPGYSPAEITVETSGENVERLELRLQATQGLTLRVSRTLGPPPDSVWVSVIDGAGNAVTGGGFATGEGGTVRLPSVPPGSWELLVGSEGSAIARVAAVAPGPTVGVTLEPQSLLEIVVPEAAEEASILVATVRGADGQLFRSGWGTNVNSEVRIYRGSALVRSLPAGTWTVEAVAPDGRRFRGTATTQPGATTTIELR